MSLIEATAVTTPADQRVENWRLMGGAVALDGCKTVDDVLKRADLNWEAELHPIHTYFQGREIAVPGRSAVIRNDKGLVLGDVGKAFAPVQNRELVDFAQALVEEADVNWDGAVGGHMKGSKVAFLNFKIPYGVLVGGKDPVNSHLIVANGHDGSTALRASVIAYRIACGNQVNAATRRNNGAYSIRHVGLVNDKVAEVRAALGLASKYMVEFQAIADRLADIDVDVAFFEDFVTELLPIDGDAGVREAAAKQRQREQIRLNFRNTETVDADLLHTGWGALNVVTEVIDHGNLDVRKSKQDKGERRFLSSLEGPGASLRHRAFDLLLGEVEEPGQIHRKAEARKVLATVGGVL